MTDNHWQDLDPLELLRKSQPFSRMAGDVLEWITQRLEPRHFHRDDVILSPKDEADSLYFVAAGRVRMEAIGKAVAPEKRLLGELTQGECFPIEALHEQRPVFSVFRAEDEVGCYVLSGEHFAELVAMDSVFRDFCDSRAAAFLDSSRRIYHSHFSRRSEDVAVLAARLGSLKCPMPQTAREKEPVRGVVAKLDQSRDGSVVIMDDAERPTGVFTVQDLLRRVLLAGGDLDQAVSQVMNGHLVALPPDADGYEAALAMAEHGVQQVFIVDQGRLVGAISERDLFSLQRVALSQLSARIRQAGSISALKLLTDDIRVLAGILMSQGLAAGPVMRMISSLNDHLTYRVVELQVQAHQGPLPPFCWIAVGSEGRHEQTLHTDQDNGIIFDPAGFDLEQARSTLLAVARNINEALAECGFPLCKGGVMASNPKWCLSLEEWKGQFSAWLANPDGDAILNATIFFDFRGVYGDLDLSRDLSTWLAAKAPGYDRFFFNIAAHALQRSPPLGGFFRDFALEAKGAHAGTIDLKLQAATLFVDAARIMALKTGVFHSNTGQRILESAVSQGIPLDEAKAWVEAFHFIQLQRLRRQYELITDGQEPHNRIKPDELNELDRKVLLESLRQARKVQKTIELKFSQGARF